MTTKIAAVANLAFHVFQQTPLRSAIGSAAAMCFNLGTNESQNSVPSRPMPQNDGSRKNQRKNLPDALRRLLLSIRSLTPKDVGFDSRWISDSHVYAAPVAYVHIMENEVFSMGIFILRPGSRIPLHDHPHMYGILHVLYGSVRCRSFTKLRNVKSSDIGSGKSTLSIFAGSKWQLTDLIMARPHQDTLLTPNDYPCVLSPKDGNFHEITPVDGPAVFLDILAPPYDHDLGTRECKFYKEVVIPPSMSMKMSLHTKGFSPDLTTNLSLSVETTDNTPKGSDLDQNYKSVIQTENSNNQAIVYLIETNQPTDYWCESAEYVGPSVV